MGSSVPSVPQESAPERQQWRTVTDRATLVDLVGSPLPRVTGKVRTRLHALDVEWLAASPFCLVGTADPAGNCDVSPKGDPPGSLVHVLDDTCVALAERPGNKRMDGFHNVLANPHVGLNFFLPGRGDTLRINGRATLVAEAPFMDRMQVRGHRPVLALVVDVDEVFHHCAKAFARSGLWDPATWHPEAVPRRSVVAREVDRDPRSLDELDTYYGPDYANRLY